MSATPASLLKQLERTLQEFGPEANARKQKLVRELAHRRLQSAKEVQRLHEALCFLWAYPDSLALFVAVDSALGAFERRRDLSRHRAALDNSGIAGTTTDYRFYWPIAAWLAERWPQQLRLDWAEIENPDRLTDFLRLLVAYPESDALDDFDFTARDWLRRLRGGQETDATFVVRRIAATYSSAFAREEMHDGLDLAYQLIPAPGTPSRTSAKYRPATIVYQERPLQRDRPVLHDAVRERPVSVRRLSRPQGQVIVDMSRAAMVTRSRDLYVFGYGDAHDVHLVDFGDGLQFAVIGFVPERRLLLHAVYGFLTLHNGVPIGYVLSSSLFETAGIAYNTFETYRGGESARVFGRVLAMVRHLFRAERFTIDPYQLGYGNEEGQKSGAWWFYYKLGFRPNDPAVRRVLRGELRKMQRNPAHRSSPATIERLAAADMFLNLSGKRDRFELLPLENIALKISESLAERFGADRERGLRTCATEAAQLLRVRDWQSWPRGERLAWERWSPLILLLPGVRRWTPAQRHALVAVARAKGGASELDYVRRFERHAALKRALLALAERA